MEVSNYRELYSTLLSFFLENNSNNLNNIPNGNQIRGDRISLADARKRREEESRNRLRRLSSLAPEEVNRVRRNSSRLSCKLTFSPAGTRRQNDVVWTSF